MAVTQQRVVKCVSAEVVFCTIDSVGTVFKQIRNQALTVRALILGTLFNLSEPLVPSL